MSHNGNQVVMYHAPRSDTSLVALAQQLLQQHQYKQQWWPQSKAQFAAALAYQTEPTSVLDLCSPTLDSMPSQQVLRMEAPLFTRPVEGGQCATVSQTVLQQRAGYGIVADTSGSRCGDRELASVELPALKLDDFHDMGFGSGSVVGERLLEGGVYPQGGSEWMDLVSDLQPCESTESSALPVVVDVWQDDFTLPRDLCVPSESSEEVGVATWRPTADELLSLQNKAVHEDRYDIQHCLHPLQQLDQLQEQAFPDDTAPARSGKEQADMEVGVGEGETGVSDYSGAEERDHGVQLVHLLLECAEAMDGGWRTAAVTLRHLRDLSSPYGDPMQRVAAYFCDALARRLAKSKGIIDPCAGSAGGESLQESMVAYRALNEACPYSKFAHLTANQAILEALDSADCVHIIDFGIMQGVQWAALLQAFATRPGGRPPPKIRITGIGGPKLGCDTPPSLLATGKRLHEFAALLKIDFEFCPIVARLEEVDIGMLRVDPTERVAVNFMLQLYQLLGDSSLPLQRMLQLVHSLKPAVVTLTEYEISLNGPAFQPLFVDALHFYCAIFDSLDATMPRDCQDRLNVESLFFAKEIDSIVAFEGARRKERHEDREQWSSIMQGAGFHNAPLSHYATSQAHQLLWLYCDNFRLHQGPGCLSLGWQDRPLITVSAWLCS